MWKRIVVLLASILVARAPAANAKAFYVNCYLKGTGSGTNVMRGHHVDGKRAIDSVNLIRASSNSYRPGDTIKVKISNLKGIGSVINFSGVKYRILAGMKNEMPQRNIQLLYSRSR